MRALLAAWTVFAALGCGGSDGNGSSEPSEPSSPTAHYAERCDDNDDCVSGLCAKTAGLSICSQLCHAEPCPNNDQCVAVESMKVCNPVAPGCPADCNGCCVNGQCKVGSSLDSCGSGGEDCRKCSASEICRGTCKAAFGRQWVVTVKSARISTYDASGGAWDKLGGAQPDPLVILRIGDHDLSGQGKSGQSWTGQNRPVGDSGPIAF